MKVFKDKNSQTKLIRAVIEGNLKVAKQLREEGKINIEVFNTQDNNDMTAVMHAAERGYQEILKFFYNVPGELTNDQDVRDFSYTTTDNTGCNAFMLAIKNGHTDCFDLLYCKVIQKIINHQDNDGKTPLMLAFDAIANANKFGNKEEATNLLNKLFEVIEGVFDEGKGSTDIPDADKLNLTLKDKEGLNIFAYAEKANCEQKLLEFITCDIRFPVNKIIPDISIKKSPCQQSENIEMDNDWIPTEGCEVIIEDNEDEKVITKQSSKTALIDKVIEGNLEVVKQLCKKGKIDIRGFNLQDENGMTAVMHAAKMGYQEILKLFYSIPEKLTHSYRQNFSYAAREHKSGDNALMLAIKNGYKDCLKFLYCKEIQYIINHQNKDGKTPIMLAFDAIVDANKSRNEEEVKKATNLLDELFRVIETIFNKRDEKHLNPSQNNKLDFTIQDQERLNIFEYSKKAGCKEKLEKLIEDLNKDQIIIPDVSIKKSPCQQSENIEIEKSKDMMDNESTAKNINKIQTNIEGPDNGRGHGRNIFEVLGALLQSQSNATCLTNSQAVQVPKQGFSANEKLTEEPKTHKRSAAEEEIDNHNAKQVKIENIKNSKKIIKITLNKPSSMTTEVLMRRDRLMSGIKKGHLCAKPKSIWSSEGSKRSVNVIPTQEWLCPNLNIVQHKAIQITCSDTATERICNGIQNKKNTPHSQLTIQLRLDMPQGVQSVCHLASRL